MGSTQRYDAHKKYMSDATPSGTVSWRDYIVHMLMIVVIIEGIIIFHIYKRSGIEGLGLKVISGFVCIAFALIFVRFFIEFLIEMKCDFLLEDKSVKYVIDKKSVEVINNTPYKRLKK
jgi:hypothetical protein